LPDNAQEFPLASRFNSLFISGQLIALLRMLTGLPAEKKKYEST